MNLINKAIEVDHLVKHYGDKQVLKDISFTVEKGEIFALLGMNGAGKTTTLECIEGLRKYNDGSIKIHGSFGVQLQTSSLPSNMKVKEVLTLFSKWQKSEINQPQLQHLGISSFMNQMYEQLSTGQKRRLHLALALLGNPDIIFLDEPTAALDVEGRYMIHNEIRELKKQGKTLIIATHDMSEVEELCDHIVILRNGEIAFDGVPNDLLKEKKQNSRLEVLFSCEINTTELDISVTSGKEINSYIFETKQIESTLSDILEICRKQNARIFDIRIEQAAMGQRLIEITKENA